MLICTDMPDFFQVAQAVDRGIEGPGNAAKGVMRLRICAVQADGNSLYAASAILRATSFVTSVPLVASATRNPFSPA